MNLIIDLFEHTLQNLKVTNADKITARRDEITKSLNKYFRNDESATTNRLMVGSWGRHTAINGVSDLDMIYVLPSCLRNELHKADGPKKVLLQTKNAIARHYSSTSISVDRLVVVVQFSNFKFEIQPCFENDDGSFEYPDTYSNSWKKTDPRSEIEAISSLNDETKGNARKLCRLARAWKRKHAVTINGLLIDTLVWRFFNQTTQYREQTLSHDEMVLEFFTYLSQLPKQEHWSALGSRQNVKVKQNFQMQAKKAVDLCKEAIAAKEKPSMFTKWRKIFGRFVPASSCSQKAEAEEQYQDTEEFIEDFYSIDLRYQLQIDCSVTQDGFRSMSLHRMLSNKFLLRPNKNLNFTVVSTTVPEPYELRWKVLNRGDEAERRNEIRGQIIRSQKKRDLREHTTFRGDHYVECYAIKNEVVVARGHIEVPIHPASSS